MEPKVIEVLENGTLRGEGGRFLPGSKPTTAISSSEQASAMAKRMHELAKEKAQDKLAEKAERLGYQRSAADAVAALAGKAYDAAHSGFEGDKVVNADGSEWYRVDRRGGVLAGKFALELAGMATKAEETEGKGSRLSLDLAPGVAERMFEVIATLASRSQADRGKVADG